MNDFKTVGESYPKMTVDVWSDIMCPFCYIGKRNFESALGQFKDPQAVEIAWHSFQLDPTIPQNPDKKENVYAYLAAKKGMSYEYSVKLHESLVETAKKAGLEYHFEKAIVANSFDAHRLIQLANSRGLGDQAEERLFRAYFTEGRDFGNHETLLEIGREIGLSESEINNALQSDDYSAKVEKDIQEASDLGIPGVPFFVFNRQYAVSGAQPPEYFLRALNQSFESWRKTNPASEMQANEGAVCTPDGLC
jgi:predicted DsbA family dithiol-disulfide isomerase